MNIRVALLIGVGLVQLAVPGWMIFQQEQTLWLGKEYKFETEPVDPYDLFRGRYVALRFKASDGKTMEGKTEVPNGSKVYVAVKTNAAGFAEVERTSQTPIAGDNVFEAKLQYNRLNFPFERYYMEESRAPAAEAAYRKANTRNSKKPTWAAVRIWHGNAALADLFIDGQSIREYLRNHPEPKK